MPVLNTQHDHSHPVEEDSAWSESWLFGGYDPVTDAGLDTRIGIRPNEGTMDIWMEIWLPNGRFAHVLTKRPQTKMIDGDLEMSGIRYERVAPMQEWRVVGETVGVRRSHFERDTEERSVRVAVDVQFTALTAAIGADSQGRAREAHDPARTGFHVGHFEQAVRLRGFVQVDDERYDLVDARGMRDKSWGPRRWEHMEMWRWFALNFGDDIHVGASVLAGPRGVLHRGWIWREGRHRSLRHVEIKTELERDGIHVRRSSLRLIDSEGQEHFLQGEMIWIAEPEIHGQWATETGRTVIHMGLGRWEYEDRIGYGLSDYAHHLGPDGKPVVPIQ